MSFIAGAIIGGCVVAFIAFAVIELGFFFMGGGR